MSNKKAKLRQQAIADEIADAHQKTAASERLTRTPNDALFFEDKRKGPRAGKAAATKQVGSSSPPPLPAPLSSVAVVSHTCVCAAPCANAVG